MPELPEVETIARALREGGRDGPPLPGRVIESAELLWARSLAQPDAAEFLARVPGQSVRTVGRRAKFLTIQLDRDILLYHLRMSGDVRVEARGEALQKHDRLLLNFVDGIRLVFNDPRKFGRVWLLNDPNPMLNKLGPEPLDPDFKAENLYARLQRTKRQIKPLLLDQAFLAGMGNIYSDEALHRAGLHPLLPSNKISSEQAGLLLESIRGVLDEGIRRNGASIDWVYRGGDFQNAFRVYQRTGQPCPVCGNPIVRIVVGQRSTHFCAVCQPIGTNEI
jgi:formamidopyrimidine-DNA glycosylase